MSKGTIGVGILAPAAGPGTATFAPSGQLVQFPDRRLSSRRQETADAVAAELDVPRGYGGYQALIADPDVDLVVIPAPGPEHAYLVRAAIAGGKDVYGRMASDHHHGGVGGAVAAGRGTGCPPCRRMQRRFAPAATTPTDVTTCQTESEPSCCWAPVAICPIAY